MPVNLEVWDHESALDSFLYIHLRFSKDGYDYDTLIGYIPDKGVVNRETVKERLKESLGQCGTTDTKFLIDSKEFFTNFMKNVDPQFVEMSFKIKESTPYLNDAVRSDELLENSIYLSYGKGDWKDYATLRLADSKFK